MLSRALSGSRPPSSAHALSLSRFLSLLLAPVWFGRVPVCVESKRFECKIIIKQWGSLKAGAVGVGGGRERVDDREAGSAAH